MRGEMGVWKHPHIPTVIPRRCPPQTAAGPRGPPPFSPSAPLSVFGRFLAASLNAESSNRRPPYPTTRPRGPPLCQRILALLPQPYYCSSVVHGTLRSKWRRSTPCTRGTRSTPAVARSEGVGRLEETVKTSSRQVNLPGLTTGSTTGLKSSMEVPAIGLCALSSFVHPSWPPEPYPPN